jgi:hypothetical protein
MWKSPFPSFFESGFKESPEHGMPGGLNRRILAVGDAFPVELAPNFPTAAASAS